MSITFASWPYGSHKRRKFLHHLNNLTPSVQSKTETGMNNTVPCFDILITRRELTTLYTVVYRKPTPSRRHIHFDSKHAVHMKKGTVHNLYTRALFVRVKRNWIKRRNLKNDLWLND
jgi:hypothetical protein